MYLYWIIENIRRTFNSKPYLPLFWANNHASIILNEWEYEALGHGVKKSYYFIGDHDHAIEFNIPSDKEAEVKNYLDKQENKPYEKINFFWHIIYIFTNRWFGSYNDKRHSCVELVARSLQVAGVEVDKYDNPYLLEYKLRQLYGKPVTTKPYPKDFISHLHYWSIPAMKLFMAILVIIHIGSLGKDLPHWIDLLNKW